MPTGRAASGNRRTWRGWPLRVLVDILKIVLPKLAGLSLYRHERRRYASMYNSIGWGDSIGEEMARHEKGYSQDENGKSYGPSWYDVHMIIAELRAAHGLELTFHVKQCRAVDGSVGMYITAVLDGTSIVHVGAGFGRSHPTGAKTMPAAMYQLATLVYHWLDDISDDDLQDRYHLTKQPPAKP